ncbi:molybdopterin-binding domain-containing protein [Tautonia sociabilis]|uniref:Formylmethanofuran dehydrogenase subunit B n=1 Tax=Tautonia sociabilis TaxID=2080755 RepID=A0A432MIG3_9BACT|nr:formylmethanofuran dehydrogenase subunit B [Tautonia sociabilis]RUL87151.1 formylmethanofuran dehydrogenase subunit B [Tautonia sociabilis]
MTTATSPPIDPRRVEDATCPACGLLCDDLVLTVANGRVIRADRACERGRAWFLADHRREELPEATVDGVPVPTDEAIGRASAILIASRAPTIAGLSAATTEAQAIAARLADRLGATIGPDHAEEAWPRVAAIQRAGAALGSFGEVANRADLILLWGLEPEPGLPRLRERLIDRPGRFVPEARAGRTVLVVDSGSSTVRSWADGAIAVGPGSHAEALRALRAAVLGIPSDPDRLVRASGAPLESWLEWADRLRAARYGAILFGSELAREGAEAIEALMRLLDDLKASTRCVALPMAGPGNPTGAEAVLTARLGAPLSVDLSAGAPRFLPCDAEPELRLLRGEADAVLVLGEPTEELEVDRPPGVPLVLIGPAATSRSEPGVVAIATGTPALDEGGSIVRSDEVTLPLRPPLEPIRPSAAEVLGRLLDRIGRDSIPE